MMLSHRLKRRLGILTVLVGALLCASLDSHATTTLYPSGEEVSTIQEAIDRADPGSTIVISCGEYHENLSITKPLTLLGIGEVLLIPVNRAVWTVRIAETEGVLIRNIGIEAAPMGFKITGSTCRITRCRLHTTDTGVEVVAIDPNRVSLDQCSFSGEGIGVLTVGDGVIEVIDCQFHGLGTGALLGGATSVLVSACTFEECHEGISLASSAKGTLVDNCISDSRGSGILVGPAPFHTWDGPMILVSNTIRNSAEWDVSLCGISPVGELSFQGQLHGFGNSITASDEPRRVCPADYEWPEGFFTTLDE